MKECNIAYIACLLCGTPADFISLKIIIFV